MKWSPATWVILLVIGFALAIAVVAWVTYRAYRELARENFLRDYTWPPGLLDKLAVHYPSFTRKETALVAQGLRQFFLAYLHGGRRYVAMPSQVADELWHEFILYTRAYAAFCEGAFGGFLHHTPAVALRLGQKVDNTGLRRVWRYCCREEGINAHNPSRLPLLFALDTKLKIPNGYYYHPQCDALRKRGDAGTQCGGDFASFSYDGGTDGLGDSGETGGSDSSGSDSGSCGGGSCGGGGD
ncbi:hypothetical protein GJW-30_1_02032 [Variibacter gotjawalensis]|uniref:Uncharacterized protein n=1 Tax=Variibacter gotjawalensis TaxID=1333996 RepID=A0A0S3PUB3_9BRAD|nr:hypothetical protein [Variibacter gotjawalensis]NIK49822.1 hypothetical protein [Variibacter gotjawalensis]RZS45824.1 hypothetical protein EV661_4149 [Variibacter gotjawalensis]BAT59499.1 hypothetical protein GJW-30_1_02032 [Variibacter gotjawalensis]